MGLMNNQSGAATGKADRGAADRRQHQLESKKTRQIVHRLPEDPDDWKSLAVLFGRYRDFGVEIGGNFFGGADALNKEHPTWRKQKGKRKKKQRNQVSEESG